MPRFHAILLALALAASLAPIPAAAQTAGVSTAAVPATKPTPVDLAPRPLGTPAPARNAADASQSGESSVWSHPLVRTGGALAVVLAAIFAAALVLRKAARLRATSDNLAAAIGAGGPSPAGILEVLGRYPAARGASFVLLKLDRRILLLSHTHAAGLRSRTAAGFTTLAEIADPESVASILVKAQDAEQASIAAKFSSMLRQHEHAHDADAASDPAAEYRRVRAAPEGDRAELLDDSPDAPLPFLRPSPAHSTPPGQPRRAAAAPPIPTPIPAQSFDADPMGSLRDRLSRLRGSSAGPGGRP
jgi:flagellar biogenesis protein FliO